MKKTNPYKRVPRKKFVDANAAAPATAAPEQPGRPPWSGHRSDCQAGPGGGLRCPQSAPLSSGSGPEQYSRRVPGAAQGEAERPRRVDGPGGRAGTQGGQSSNPTRPLRPPTSKPAGGQHPPTRILPQRHFRQLSRNLGGLEALWSAPLAPARRGVAGSQGLRKSRSALWGSPGCWLPGLASGPVRYSYTSLFFSSIQSSHRPHVLRNSIIYRFFF